MNCLENIIGISSNDCPCIDIDNTQAMNSISGLYLDDGETQGLYIRALSENRNCDEAKNIYDILVELRKRAILEFIEGFYATLSSSYVVKHRTSMYTIGDLKKSSGAPLLVDQYPFAYLTPFNKYRGQTLFIKKIKLEFAGGYSDTIPVYILRDGVIVDTYNLTMTAGLGELEINKKLPVMSEYGDLHEYHIAYDRKNGYPKDYKWNCGCGSTHRVWQNTFRMASGSTNDLMNIPDTMCVSEYAVGMQIVATVECDAMQFLCALDYSANHGYARTIAKTIQLISQKLVARQILNSGKVNAWTLYKDDELTSKIVEYDQQIEWRWNWLAQEYSAAFSDCFLCNSSASMIDIGS